VLDEYLPINRFIGNYLSYMCKFLFSSIIYVYEACNSTILNLSIVKKKISLGLLNYRPSTIL